MRNINVGNCLKLLGLSIAGSLTIYAALGWTTGTRVTSVVYAIVLGLVTGNRWPVVNR